jgi:hypothetical protein
MTPKNREVDRPDNMTIVRRAVWLMSASPSAPTVIDVPSK